MSLCSADDSAVAGDLPVLLPAEALDAGAAAGVPASRRGRGRRAGDARHGALLPLLLPRLQVGRPVRHHDL